MKNYLLHIIIFLLLFGDAFAQKQAWHWYFGVNAGVEFNTGSPVAVTNGAMNTYEGNATISDSSGNLLFYTNGVNVYDANHTQMPNGFGLYGNSSATQSAVIVMKPGSDSLYYIFTVDYNHDGLAAGDGLNYTIVDMSLNSGLGDVAIKNIAVRAHVYEKLTAVKHGNNNDYWILINDWFADDIYAYLLDSSGLNMTPVASNAGPFHGFDAGKSAGYLKANRQGNKIALAMWQKNSYDICDFDNLTGIASNHIIIQSPDMVWTMGVEFSPDGSKLYGTKLDPPSKLFQFDLTAGSPVAILSSRVTIATNPNLYYYCALQVAPDKKIYCSLRYDNYLAVINQPDSAGSSCNFVNNGLYLSGKQGTLGLPNFTPDYVFSLSTAPVISLASSDTSFCEKQCLNFYDLSTNNPTSWQWFFPGSDSLTSSLQNPTNICYNSYGSFDVTLIACNAAGCDTLILQNYITEYQSPVDSIYQSNDTLYSLPAYTYQWYEVTNGIIAGATNQYFVPQQAGSYYCIISDSIGCNASSSTIIITATNQISNFNFPISISPNPFNSTISITFQNQNISKASLTIKNVLGQNVYSRICPPSGVRGSSGNGSLEIDLSFLPKGIYLLDLMMDDAQCIRKIVKD
ncbi:MAG: T9SS type A sorting domain-containing protein [Bacteroidia bacterium]